MENDILLLNCPHCNILVEIVEKNCCVFRCGINKINYQQINPHSPKEICDNLKKYDLIWGCGFPFQLITENNSYKLVKCDYI